MEAIDFNEEEATKDGQELQPADTEELARKEREKTGDTTATPTELAGGNATESPIDPDGPVKE